MIYRIINPSDPYTMQADDEKVAIAACAVLGEGQYGLAAEDGETVCPILAFGGDATKWLDEKLGMDFGEFMKQRDQEVAAALDSVFIGDLEDHEKLMRVFAVIEDEQTRAKVEFEWHDSHRSSMNDIGARAKALAKRYRGTQTDVPAATRVLYGA